METSRDLARHYSAKLPDVKVELLGATLAGVKAETLGKAPGTTVTDVNAEEVKLWSRLILIFLKLQ